MAKKCVNAALIGEDNFAASFGKKGTSSDVQIYNYSSGDKVFNLVHVFSFPEKITSLVQTLNMCNVAIVHVSQVDAVLGETILALKLLKKKAFFLLERRDEHLAVQLGPLVAGLEHEIRIIHSSKDLSSLRDELLKMDFSKEGEALIEVDHAFNIKGTGVVALCVLKQGTLNARDQLTLYPKEKTVQVKSIQVMDENVKSADAQTRVGLALKNCTIKELGRGSLISQKKLDILHSFKGEFEKVGFYKKVLGKGTQLQLVHGQQAVPCVIQEVGDNSITLIFTKPLVLAFEKSLLINPGEKGLRIVGVLRHL